MIFINLLVKSFHIVRWNIWHSYGSFDIAQWDLTCAGYAHHRSVAFVKWTIWHSYVKITHDYVIFFTLRCQIFDRAMSQWHNQACRCMDTLSTEYAGKARFGGKLLSVNKEGQKLISKVITSRWESQRILVPFRVLGTWQYCAEGWPSLCDYLAGWPRGFM